MKNLLRLGLIFGVLVTITSCSGLLNNDIYGNGDLAFGFRAAEETAGGTLKVELIQNGKCIDFKEIKNLKAGGVYTVNFEKVPVGNVVDIRVELRDISGKLVLDGNDTCKIKRGENVVKIALSHSWHGYLLWNNSSLEKRYKVFDAITGNEEIIKANSKQYFGSQLKANGELLVVSYPGSGPCKTLEKYKDGKFISEKTLPETLFQGEKNIYFREYKDGLIYLLKDTSNKKGQIFYYDNSTMSNKELTVSEGLQSSDKYYYTAFEIIGDEIVIGASVVDSYSNITRVEFLKGNINITTEMTSINITKKVNMGASARNYGFYDMVFHDGFVYGTFLNAAENNSNGELLKINPTDLTIVDRVGRLAENKAVGNSEEEVSNYFVGPRKIVAILPKKLLIADDGAITLVPNTYQYKSINRITTVNLGESKMNIEGHLNLKNEMFDATPSSGSSYIVKSDFSRSE